MKEITPYEMVVRNCAIHLKKNWNPDENSLTAFDLSYGIAVGFCKDVTEVVKDIATVKIK